MHREVTSLGAVSGFECLRVTGHVWADAGPSVPLGQSQGAGSDPDTQKVIPEGTACLADCVKATVRSVCPEKGDCPTAPLNADGTPQMIELLMLPMWDWLCSDRGRCPLNVPGTQVMVSAEV